MAVNKIKCDELEDQEIVRRSLNDLEYFSCLYNRYEEKLLHYIRKISHVNHEEAEDILQESFIKIWRNLNDYDNSMKLSSWLYRIVHNETISYNRKKRSYGKNNVVPIDNLQLQDFQLELDIDHKEIDKHKLTIEILDEIPLKYKECIVLKYFEKMSYEDISDILKIPEGTVAIRINRAKKRLKRIIEKKHINLKP